MFIFDLKKKCGFSSLQQKKLHFKNRPFYLKKLLPFYFENLIPLFMPVDHFLNLEDKFLRQIYIFFKFLVDSFELFNLEGFPRIYETILKNCTLLTKLFIFWYRISQNSVDISLKKKRNMFHIFSLVFSLFFKSTHLIPNFIYRGNKNTSKRNITKLLQIFAWNPFL